MRDTLGADDDGDAHNNLGRLAHQSGDLDAAERHYRAAVRLGESSGTAYYNLGTVLEDKGDVPGAISAYRGAIASDGNNAEAHYNVARLLERFGAKRASRATQDEIRRHMQAVWRLTRGRMTRALEAP